MSNFQRQWNDIPELSGYYQASNDGLIRSTPREVNGYSARAAKPIKIKRKSHLLSQNIRGAGYLYVCICVDGRMRKEQVHKLVLMAFKGIRPDGMVACHNDGNPQNNSIENLRWDTPKENSNDMRKHGTLLVGENVKTSKLTENQVLEILKSKTFSNVCARIPVSRTQYYRIKKSESWKHLAGVHRA